MPRPLPFPGGRRFAFTILDDTDDSTLPNTQPVYDLLKSLGMRTTKTVWALDSPAELKGHYHAGQTLQDPDYRAWVIELEADGFEIAFHNASMVGSTRPRSIEAIAALTDLVKAPPRLHCNHGQNRENLYWGADRYSAPIRTLYALASQTLGSEARYEGHVEGSPYFWGDVAHDTFDYVRAFAFRKVNGADIVPGHPFLDPQRPWVRCWFNSSDAPTVKEFKTLLTPSRIADLRNEGGWCIVSTHIGKGFAENGQVDPGAEQILRAIAAEDGWFVPASVLLDHLCSLRPAAPLTARQRVVLEAGHFLDRAAARLMNR